MGFIIAITLGIVLGIMFGGLHRLLRPIKGEYNDWTRYFALLPGGIVAFIAALTGFYGIVLIITMIITSFIGYYIAPE